MNESNDRIVKPRIRVAMILAALAFFTPEILRAQPAKLDKILSGWKKRNKDIRSLKCVVIANITMPMHAHVYEQRFTWTIDFKNNRLRKELDGQVYNGDKRMFVPYRSIHIYADKQTKRYYYPGDDDSPSSMGIVKNGNLIEYSPSDLPIFYSSGMVFPVSMLTGQTGPTKARIPVDSGAFRFLGQKFIGKTKCSVLKVQQESDSHDLIWVDVANRNTVRRAELIDHGKTWCRLEVDYRKGASVPVSWVSKQYIIGVPRPQVGGVVPIKNRLFKSARFNVKEFVVNAQISNEEFDIKLRPGMNVTTADVKAGLKKNWNTKRYRVAPDGKTLIPIEK